MRINKQEAKALQKKNFRLMTALISDTCMEVQEMQCHLAIEEADDSIEKLQDLNLAQKREKRARKRQCRDNLGLKMLARQQS